MNKISKLSLSCFVMALSTSSFAYSVKTLNCFDEAQMLLKKNERVSQISLISAKIGKSYEYALANSKSIQSDDVKLERGIFELTKTNNIYEMQQADKSSLKIITGSSDFYSISDIAVTVAALGQNAQIMQKLQCKPDSAANKMGYAYLKSYEKYFKEKNSNFRSIVDDTLFLADVFKSEQKEAHLKKGEYLSLKNNAFKLKTVDAQIDGNGDITSIDEDDVVACRIKDSDKSYNSGSKKEPSLRAKCLEAKFLIKKRHYKKTRKKYNWFHTTTNDTAPILVCKEEKRTKRIKASKSNSNFHKRKYTTGRIRKPKPSKTNKV